MARYVELRRHTDADGDVPTPEGVRAATEIGARLRDGYDLLVSTGAQRATHPNRLGLQNALADGRARLGQCSGISPEVMPGRALRPRL